LRRRAARGIRRNPLDIPIDSRIAGGGGRLFQIACIEKLCQEIVNGRRKMLVEMATGTGKTRTAAALLKRLFEANWVTRALFVVDRNTLAIQAEDAFAEHLPHLPCYRVPRTGRRFQDEKRVTIVTLQTLVNEYGKYSSGYFDLIIIEMNVITAFTANGVAPSTISMASRSGSPRPHASCRTCRTSMKKTGWQFATHSVSSRYRVPPTVTR
jgi:hypothetical protein